MTRPIALLAKLSIVSTLLILPGCRSGAGSAPFLPAPAAGLHAAHVLSASLQPAIVVGNFSGHDILEFDLDATGNQAPTAIIRGKKTRIKNADNVALDKSDHIYASINGKSVAIFAAGANGNVTPIGQISGPNTQIKFPIGVALDSSGYLYVADCGTGNVKVFNPGARGNVAPIHIISLTSCTIEVAVDLHNHVFVTSGDNIITEYSAAPSGNTLLRTIDEKESSGGIGIRSIAVDSHGYIYAGNLLAKDIRVFSRNATGYANPVRTISGSKTRLGAATGLALDKPSDNLYVTICHYCHQGSGTDGILVFPPQADGNIKPTRVIAGSKTLLSSPTDLTLRQ